MKQERLKILTMVEEGKISVDEAARLLEVIKDGDTWGDDMAYWDLEDRVNKFSRNVENFGREMKAKMESAYKGMEPKLEKATKTVLEKTASIIDDISKSLNESIENMEKKDQCGCGGDCSCQAEAEDADVPVDNGPREN